MKTAIHYAKWHARELWAAVCRVCVRLFCPHCILCQKRIRGGGKCPNGFCRRMLGA